jgi:carnitine-CoA ligase
MTGARTRERPPARTGTETIASVLGRRAAEHPDRPFVLFESVGGERTAVTYAEVAALAARTAGCLRRLGVGRGSTVHVHLPNCPEFYACWFGAGLLGAAIVPTNPLSTADELSYVLEHAGCAVSVTQPDLLEPVRRAVPPATTVMVARAAEPVDDLLTFEGEVRQSEPYDGPAEPSARETAAVLYTSGTTSRPKGVVVSHAAYLHAGEAVAQHIRMRADDRTLIVLPLFHGNAQYYSTLPALVTGASIALVERFSASQWSSQSQRLGATVASLFAAPIRMILAQPESPSDRAHGLRVTMFAQNVTEQQLAEFEGRFGVPLIQLYGMTETVAPVTMNPLFGERRNMTIGRPMLWTNVRIADEAGSDVRPGEVGELLVAGEPGETIMSGYLDAPEATSDALSEGWLRTGDNVRTDYDGYLFFVDRGKDMIKRAGENVSASEVERVLNEHPAVFESACIGVEDSVRDQAIKAFVVWHQGATASEQELLAWCRERLSRFKVPSTIEILDGLPRTSVGKIQKHLLSAREAAK